MKNNDYRNTTYCSDYNDIASQKEKLKETIKKEHPRTKILYNQIRVKASKYNKIFRKIYNSKCAYCGISTDVISSELFEIDHFICESSYNGDNEKAGSIENLVLACKKCNRSKGDFIWEEQYSKKLNPDDKSITELFDRDEYYRILVKSKYESDQTINEFYDQLKFNEEVRRLDFLLMNMYGFYEKYKSKLESSSFQECIILLQKKRNNI